MKHQAAIPLDRDATGKALPWVIGLLVCLAMLALAGANTIQRSLSHWQTSLNGALTVQVLPLGNAELSVADRTTKALAVLQQNENVETARVVEAPEMQRLLAPWLGDAAMPDDLPIPALIDVSRKHSRADLSLLKQTLATIPGVVLDDHGAWLTEVRRLAWFGMLAAYGVVVLIAGAAILIVLLLVKAGLAVHRDIIELLHLVGATDEFIARQFQRHMARVALEGAVLGSMATAILLFVWQWLGGAALLAGLAPGMVYWATLAIVPLGFVLLAALTARRVVLALLARLP